MTMKTTNLIIALTAALAATQTMAESTTVGTSNAVQAQIGVTRDAINQLLNKIDERTVDSSLKVSDYRRWSVKFKQDVAAATATFEDEVKSLLQNKVAPFVDRYNGIATSTSISEEQRERLLYSLRNQLQNQARSFAKEYQSSLKNVYRTIGNYFFDFRVARLPYRKNKKLWKETLGCGKPDSKKNALIFILYTIGDDGKELEISSSCEPRNRSISVKNEVHYPMLRKQCESQACLSLINGDLIYALNTIKGTLA
jgi:hypothetical protein